MKLVHIAADSPDAHADIIVAHVYNACRFDPSRDRVSEDQARFVFGLASLLLHQDARMESGAIAKKLVLHPDQIEDLVVRAFRALEKSEDARERILRVRERVYENLETIGAHEILARIDDSPPTVAVHRNSTMIDIARAICDVLRVEYKNLLWGGRTAKLCEARFVAFSVSKSFQPARSLPEIAQRFELADHTTVLHGLRRVNEVIESPKARKNLRLFGKVALVCEKLKLEIPSLVYTYVPGKR